MHFREERRLVIRLATPQPQPLCAACRQQPAAAEFSAILAAGGARDTASPATPHLLMRVVTFS